MSQRGAAEGLLVVLLLLGLGLHIGLQPDYGVRNFEFAPNMVDSPAYAAHDANPNFADGQTLRVPAQGTVARGYEPLHVDGVPLNVSSEWVSMPPEDQARWDAYAPPWKFESLDAAGQKQILARGAEVFANVCAVCHGPAGTGGSLVVPRGVPLPPSLLDEKVRPLSDGHMFQVITLGKGAITPGKGNMPAHANHVSREDRWKVIRHVRKLQEAAQ
jgi:mono/diheme cytochrome c family protein